jgi:hypothetical protein
VDVHARRTNAESDRTVSRERATLIGGLWIQALTLLGPREIVRTAANMPPTMQYFPQYGPNHRISAGLGRIRRVIPSQLPGAVPAPSVRAGVASGGRLAPSDPQPSERPAVRRYKFQKPTYRHDRSTPNTLPPRCNPRAAQPAPRVAREVLHRCCRWLPKRVSVPRPRSRQEISWPAWLCESSSFPDSCQRCGKPPGPAGFAPMKSCSSSLCLGAPEPGPRRSRCGRLWGEPAERNGDAYRVSQRLHFVPLGTKIARDKFSVKH